MALSSADSVEREEDCLDQFMQHTSLFLSLSQKCPNSLVRTNKMYLVIILLEPSFRARYFSEKEVFDGSFYKKSNVK